MIAIPWPIRRLAHIARVRGDLERAVRLSIDSLTINRDVDEWQGVAASLVALAQVADAEQQPELGVRLLSRAEAVFAPTGLQLLPFDRAQHELIVAQLHARLDQATWDEAWRAGREWSFEQAIEATQRLVRGC